MKPSSTPLSETKRLHLLESYGKKGRRKHEDDLENLVLHSPQVELSPLGEAIKNKWDQEVKEKKQPLLLVVVMESMRAVDLGVA